jgi:peptide/nickel transport system substrate-binding protein
MTLKRLLLATTAIAFTASAALADGVLRIGRESDSKTLDPIRTAENLDIWVANNMNAMLVRSDPSATEIVPDLAESWEISEDGRTYTFTLRDAQFSDGDPVLASDVVFSLLRVRDDPASAWAANYSNIESVEATGDRTVVVTLTEPSTPFLATLSMVMAAIVPEDDVTEKGEAFGSEPVGAGAFRLVEWTRGSELVLEANPHYWEEDLPKLDGVEWVAVVEDNTRILQVQTGELDAALFMPFNRIPDLQANPDIQVHLDPSTRTDHVLINHTHPELSKPELRQALAHATDKQAIVEVATFGYGTPANSYVPAGTLYYNPDNYTREFDLEKARALMEEAGLADGVELELMIQAGDRVEEQVAILLQQQWAEIGVDLSIRKIDPSQWYDALVAGEYELGTAYWTNDMIDTDQKVSFGFAMDSNMNFLTRYDAPELAELTAAARVESEPEKRMEMYHEIQRVGNEDVNVLNLYYSPFRNISRAGVDGFVQNPLGRFLLETVTIEE